MGDDTQTNGPVMNGDDELAKTLTGSLKFEETPSGSGADKSSYGDPTGQKAPIDDPSADDTPPTMDDVSSSAGASDKAGQGLSDLDKLKSSALDDLKPLVGKLNLSPEEKFDTLLLIIRSTDDQSLLQEAHAAAKEISDDSKRAQALLDIIKEVDYFNSKNS